MHPLSLSSRDAHHIYSSQGLYEKIPSSYHPHYTHHLDHYHHQVLKSIRGGYYDLNNMAHHTPQHLQGASALKRPDINTHYIYNTDIPRNSHRVLPGGGVGPLPTLPVPTTTVAAEKILHTEQHLDSKFEASQLLLKVSEPTSHYHHQHFIHQQQHHRLNQKSPLQQQQQPQQISRTARGVGRPSTTAKETINNTNNNICSTAVANKQPAKPNTNKTPTKYLITADGEQRPQCPECFQTFKKRAALERHMMIHRGIKPFQCHFCNQRFRQKHHLQGHIMLHTGERPHSCGLCNKRFRMRHHLLEHERISHKVFR